MPLFLKNLSFICMLVFSLEAIAEGRIHSYRAYYEIFFEYDNKLGADDIGGFHSTIVNELCEGWETRSHGGLEIFFGDKLIGSVKSQMETWEDKAGFNYRFKFESLDTINKEEKFAGTASMSAELGDGGRVVFRAPERKVFKLPPFTLFPHAADRVFDELLEEGETAFTYWGFDGVSVEGARKKDVRIGPRQTLQNPIDGFSSVYRSVKVIEFKNGKTHRELTFRIHENGVHSRLLVDYGSFAYRYEIAEFEPLPPPSC